MSEVPEGRVDWLWKPFFPLGMMSFLHGDPGLGKSALLCDLAAKLTQGNEMPNGAKPRPVSVLMLIGDDDVGKTVKPRLREKLNRESEPYPEAWMPGPGGELLGTFEGYRQGKTSRGEVHPIALVRDDTGELHAIWMFFTVLRAEFEQANPHVGETILVRREEDRTNADGQPYRRYRVTVDRPEKRSPFANTSPPVEERTPPTGDWTFLGDGVQ